jgi:hypothetical protein
MGERPVQLNLRFAQTVSHTGLSLKCFRGGHVQVPPVNSTSEHCR